MAPGLTGFTILRSGFADGGSQLGRRLRLVLRSVIDPVIFWSKRASEHIPLEINYRAGYGTYAAAGAKQGQLNPHRILAELGGAFPYG